MTAPYVYIASLSDYNNGTLHGVWIFADQDADDIQEEISEMLAASADPGAEEWAIHDYEGFPIRLGEWESVGWLAALGQAIAEHGPDAVEAACVSLGADSPDSLETALSGFTVQLSWDDVVTSFADACGLYELAAKNPGLVVDERDIRVTLESNGSYHETSTGAVVEFY